MDWGAGEYELTAVQLEQAARVAVDRLAPSAGERIVDLGCGTGTASVLVAATGADLLGVDPSTRLLQVAARRAADEGLEATFAEGTAADLPVEDGSLDAVISVFGLIFAPDPVAAAEEILRALRPGGRLVYSAWLPEGPVVAGMSLRGMAMADLEPGGGPPFAWHDRDAVSELLAPFGGAVELDRHDLAFAGTSAAEFVDSQMRAHPMWLEARARLEPLDRWDGLSEKVHEHFEAANEDPAAFRVTSSYVVIEARVSA
jgi:SAM-dependent methyltransferase